MKNTQLLLISNMYLSKNIEHVNPGLILMTVIHTTGIFSEKNILQENVFSLCLYVLGFFFSVKTISLYLSHLSCVSSQ